MIYGLIFSDKLPSAKKFKHWVTSDQPIENAYMTVI